MHDHSAVDGEGLAVDVAGGGEYEVERSVCDFFGVAVSAEGDATAREFGFGVVGDSRGHAGVNGAGADAVDGDAALAEFDGEGSGKADDAVFAGGVGAAAFGCA